MIPFLMLASTAISAGAQIAGGIGAAKTAAFDSFQVEFKGRLDGFNIETERVLYLAEASQRSRDRLEMYRQNLSSNIASFAASGRDVGGQDRSVANFLNQQKEIAGEDVARVATMADLNARKMRAESMSATSEGVQRAAAIRAQGQAQAMSSMIGAFSTIAGGLYQYNQIRTPTVAASSSSLPQRAFLPPPARPTSFFS
jgi:hypothetical protein